MAAHGFEAHNHASCIATAMAAAEARCAASNLQFTPVRRRVLEILLREHRAMGAYDILGELSAEGLGSQPPVAYRALEFLVRNGFAHKLEKQNAYIACARPGTVHLPVFMVCRACQTVAEGEASPLKSALSSAAEAAGFHIESAVVEAEGLCPSCQETQQ